MVFAKNVQESPWISTLKLLTEKWQQGQETKLPEMEKKLKNNVST